MKLYVHADESGTFDKVHNDLFVYGGLVVPDTSVKAELERRYIAVENDIKTHSERLGCDDEAKACHLSMRERKRLYQVIETSPCQQFGTIVRQDRLQDSTFSSKRTKQRCLDWALKMGIKKCVCAMLSAGSIDKRDVKKMDVYVDEHSSSTDGKYNLSESINEEFRVGMYDNSGWYHAPVFSLNLPVINVRYLDSKKVSLIRAADITANWIFCAERDRSSYPDAYERLKENVVLYQHP
ncbi:DUF3800 domain-containing protein [Parafannyhessea umbonata]|uniref:DUF3800 domain-containing protein n=1 Tax=Parafannyhessea umbonata TaxID=604330 RepID=UPI00115FBD65|nr:DUF3800 domain-containing protein [Parafannyhessea umbonata]